MAEAGMTVDRVWRIAYDKCTWIVKDAIVINEENYVSLPRRKASCCTFARMCCKDSPTDVSLVASIGYTQLAQMRNLKQAEDMASGDVCPKEPASLPSGQTNLRQLFSAQLADCTTPIKRPSMTRSRMKEVRQNKELIEVTIPAFGEFSEMRVSMMRPAHPSEDIVVPLDADVISRIVEFIKFKGFDENLMRARRDPRLPKGVWPRRHKDGTTKYYKKTEGGEPSKLRRVSIKFEEVEEEEYQPDGLEGGSDSDGRGEPGGSEQPRAVATVKPEAVATVKPEVAQG